MPSTRRWQAPFWITLVVLVVNALLAWHNVQIMVGDSRRVTHSYETLRELDHLLIDLVNAETGQRGYVLTGKEVYLAPYRSAISSIETRLARLRFLMVDDRYETERLGAFALAVHAELLELRNTLDLRRAQGLAAAQREVLSDVAKQRMDDIRGRVAELETLENRELSARHLESAASVRWAILSLALASMVAACFLLIARGSSKREVAERVRANEADRRSRETMEAITDAYYAIDRRWRFTYVNGPATERLGKPAAEVLGRTMWEMSPELRETAFEAEAHRAMAELRPADFQMRLPQSDRWYQMSLYPSRDGLTVISRDITLEHQLQDALRESEARFRLALRNAPITVYTADLEQRYTWIHNPHPAFQPEMAIGKRDDEILPLASVIDLMALKQHVLDAGRGARQEVVVPIGGVATVYDVSAEPLRDPLGKLVGLTAAAVDITERKRAEESLRQMQKLESIGLLAGGIAHDFNNILAGITGGASLALDQLPNPHPAREMLEIVVRSCERAAGLSRQLLAYAGKTHFSLQNLDLDHLMAEMVELLAFSITPNVRLERRPAPGLPLVRADATQLQQVILNLVLNGAEAIGHQRPGTVTLTSRSREVTGEDARADVQGNVVAPGSYVALRVQDNGCGMDEATKARIFDPFFTTKFTGRGLGLAGVLGIIRGHHGSILLESTPGQGSAFEILLPAVEQTVAGPVAPTRKARPSRATGHVLVVDDEEVIRRLARSTLEREGYTVDVAGNGREAIDVFRARGRPSWVVLLDMTMPGVDGLATLRELRELCPDLRVIGSSGYGEDVLGPNSAGEKGFQAFLAKPYAPTLLLRRVQEVLTLVDSRLPLR